MPLGEHVFGLESALSEDGAVLLGLLCRVPPALVEELELLHVRSVAAASPLEEHGLQQNLGERVTVVRYRDRHAELLANLGGLAQDDVEHRSVDGIVGAV